MLNPQGTIILIKGDVVNQLLVHTSGKLFLIAVLSDVGCVWYVGQAVNLKSRWNGRGHHRYPQLSRSNGKRNYKIFWKASISHELDQMERYYINLFQPSINKTKVKKYSLGKPQLKIETSQDNSNSEYIYFRGDIKCYQEISEYVGVFPCTSDDEQNVPIDKSQVLNRGYARLIAIKYEVNGKSKTTKLLCSWQKISIAFHNLRGKSYRGGKIVSVRQPLRVIRRIY